MTRNLARGAIGQWTRRAFAVSSLGLMLLGCQTPSTTPIARSPIAPQPSQLATSRSVESGLPLVPAAVTVNLTASTHSTNPAVAVAESPSITPQKVELANGKWQRTSPGTGVEIQRTVAENPVINVVPISEEELPPPATVDLDLKPVPGTERQVYPLDLPTALRLGDANSLEIELARNRYAAALNREKAAAVIWLPDLVAGPNYQFHDGQIQRAIGEVFDTRRNSLFVGGGPVLSWDLAEMCYTKLAAHQTAHARYSGAGAARNQSLLDVAEGYFDLLAAHGAVAVAQETRTNAERLTDIMDSFVKQGVGFQADAARARTEFKQRQSAERLAKERTVTLSASLARRMHLDPRVQLVPVEHRLVPLDLWSPEGDVNGLVELALQHRPEVEESRWLVDAATTKFDQAKLAPFLPKVQVGFTAGGFGGGYEGDPNGFFNRFDNREDLSASAVWQLKNLGLGDRYRIQNEQLELRSAELQLTRVVDRVSEEVVSAHESVMSRREQLVTAREAVVAAVDSLEKYLKRIREGAALPMEAVQSIRALDSARSDYLQSLTAYNKAQYRLFTATGNAAIEAQTTVSR